jgi:phosphodiesterase/alkaline phosphatase D-like protein
MEDFKMKLSLAFLFVSVLALCFAAGQSKPGSTVGQNSATSTEDQEISNGPVAEYVSDSNCTIGWSTRAPGTMTLRYGTDPTKMTQSKEAVEGNDGRNHHVRLDGLTPGTRYYFRVLNAGQAIGGIGTFQTLAAGDPPVRSKAIIPQ